MEMMKGKMHQIEESAMEEDGDGEGLFGGGERSAVGFASASTVKEPGGRSTEKERETTVVVAKSGDTSQPEQQQTLARRIKIPLFDGENSESWVVRLEQYFELEDFTEEQKPKAVRMCFESEALMWYRWERGRNPFTSWDQMRLRVLEQFSETIDTSAGERLLTLRQTGTVREYIREFVALATNAPEVPESILEMAFMIGLKPKIRTGVRMFEPKTLKKMMNLAKAVEEWSTSEMEPEKGATGEYAKGSRPYTDKKFSGPTSLQKPTNFKSKSQNTSPTTTSRGKPNQNQTSTSHGRLKAPFRRLTSAEYARWKKEGLCYKCDEKYVYPHVCARKELMVMLVHENGTETELLEEPVEQSEIEEPVEQSEIEERSSKARSRRER